jgi:hypothetical protein
VREVVYSIEIRYRDDENNRLLTLGDPAWLTQQDWGREWDAIPAASDGTSRCIADKIDENDDIVADRLVSRETVESLLGKPISQLIEERK